MRKSRTPRGNLLPSQKHDSSASFPRRNPKVPPQHIKEKFVENEELSHGGRWIGRLADQHNERLLKEWPGLLNMSADEFEAIAQDLEARRP